MLGIRMLDRAARTHQGQFAAALLVLAAVAGTPQIARADTTIAADLNANVPVADDYDFSAGSGFGIRIGQQWHLPLIVLNPELGFSYANFASHSPTVYRGVVGARLGIGEIVRFGVLAHIGFAHIGYPDRVGDAQLVADADHTGLTFDAGISVDFTLLPLLDLGVHATYNNADTADRLKQLQWLEFGVHAALVL